MPITKFGNATAALPGRACGRIDPDGNVVAFHAGEIDFHTLDLFFKENIPKYRALGRLDERPYHFQPEKKTTSSTPLRYPGKVLADPVGNRLFISDSGHNRIVVTSMDGKVLSKIGAGSIGKTDGNFAIATFNHPQGLALAGELLYVADTENHLLRKVDLKNQRVLTIAGNGEEARPDSQVVEATKRFNARPLDHGAEQSLGPMRSRRKVVHRDDRRPPNLGNATG